MAAVIEVSERCYDADMRVERIVHLGTMATVEPDYDLTEWLVNEAGFALASILGIDAADLNVFLDDDGELTDEGREELPITIARHAASGWIIEVAQPEFTKTPSGARSYSWGIYTTKCFGSSVSYDDALAQAFAWAEHNIEEARS